ncbi:MAG: hypothetical protein ACR2H2_10040 [Solirubrobacteraceae bacterium]
MRSLRFILGTLAVVALLAPAGASAQATNAPPGNSAIDEYLETVPSATGNQPPRGRERQAAAPMGRKAAAPTERTAPTERKAAAPVLTPAQRTVLERHGTEGEALAEFVESTPSRVHQRDPLAEAEGRSPLAKAVQTTLGDSGGDGGMGILLPLILSSALLVTVAVVVVRRRSGSPPRT